MELSTTAGIVLAFAATVTCRTALVTDQFRLRLQCSETEQYDLIVFACR